jgi:nucleoside diphosphate kinase
MPSLIIIKPEGMPAIGKILDRLSEKGFALIAGKITVITKDLAANLYHMHQGKYFYESLVEYMSSGTVFVGAVAGDPQLLVAYKKELRETLTIKIPPFTPSNGVTKETYEKEYKKAFDIFHCSDPKDGIPDKEVALFFKQVNLMTKQVPEAERQKLILQRLEQQSKSANPSNCKGSFFNITEKKLSSKSETAFNTASLTDTNSIFCTII